MKKIITIIAIIALFIFLIGCGENNATPEIAEVGSDLMEISNFIPNYDSASTEDDSSTIESKDYNYDYDGDYYNSEDDEITESMESDYDSDSTPTEDDNSTIEPDVDDSEDFNCGEGENDETSQEPESAKDDDYTIDYDSGPLSTGEVWIGSFRPIFYSLPAPFVDLIGREAYFAWLETRSCEEMMYEHMAVAAIKYFNISKEDFSRTNDEMRQLWESIGFSSERNSSFEPYPVDLLFTFDMERINEYFLWENTPVAQEFGMGMELGIHRPLFYNMPAPFVNLVGRETFIEWRRSRSQEERENENIAISFVRHFNISREDFTRANEEMRQVWANYGFYDEAARIRAEVNHGWTQDVTSRFEVYDVDMIFSFDNAQVSEFFLWENSPIEHERYLGEVARARRAEANN